MKNNTGFWIILDTTPSQYVNIGLPKIGDTVSLIYDKKGMPWTGIAKLVQSTAETAQDFYVAQEFGGSFIYAANFGG